MNYQSINPVTEEEGPIYPEVTWEEARSKAEQARQAFQTWRNTSFEVRSQLVHRLAALVRDEKEAYSSLMSREMGKPIVQAEAEIDKCAWGCNYYADHAEEFLREEMVSTDAAKSYIRYDPLGVILGIMPWNFPFWQVFRFAVPVLMAGNIILLKHAPNVPGCALTIQEIFKKAGFPDFVFQSLFLSNENTARLIESGFIQGVSLTGSERAGSAVAAVAGRSLVKTVLELGGSDPFIILEDADIEKLVPMAIRSRMLNTGQSCIAAKRFIVIDKIYRRFKEAFGEKVLHLKVGDPMDRTTEVGPLARKDLLENLTQQVDESVQQGAKVITGGVRSQGKGFFYPPTILELETIRPGMPAFDQEVFGPVASLISVDNEKEAIALANRTSYGLGASLWTRNLSRAESLARDIEAGSVFINGMVRSDPRLPFGGVKRSGYGRELSAIGVREFTNIKTVWIA